MTDEESELRKSWKQEIENNRLVTEKLEALNVVLIQKQKTISVMEALLLEKGIIVDLEKVEELHEKLKEQQKGDE